MKNRIIALLLVVTILLSALPIEAVDELDLSGFNDVLNQAGNH